MTCGGRSWAGPERGSEILCVLTHGMGSTPPPQPVRLDDGDRLRAIDRCGGCDNGTGLSIASKLMESECHRLTVSSLQQMI